MRVHGLILSLAMLAAPAVASAQDNAECLGQSWSGYAQAKNLCNIAVDGTHYFHPQLHAKDSPERSIDRLTENPMGVFSRAC